MNISLKSPDELYENNEDIYSEYIPHKKNAATRVANGIFIKISLFKQIVYTIIKTNNPVLIGIINCILGERIKKKNIIKNNVLFILYILEMS